MSMNATIKTNIKSLLAETHKKQSELAMSIGSSTTAVSNWLTNEKTEIPSRFIPEIAKFFGIPIEGLFWDYVSVNVRHDVLIHDGTKKYCPRCGYSEISEEDQSCRNCGLLFVNHCTDPNCRMNTGWDDPVCLSYTTCYCPECGAKTTFFENGDITEKTCAFDYATSGLTEDEQDLLEIFRSLDKSGKRILLGQAEQMKSSVNSRMESQKIG